MVHVKCWTLCMVGFVFLTTADSTTETQQSISGALINGNATQNSDMQRALNGSTDEINWEVTKHRILSSTMGLLSNVSSVDDILNLGFKGRDGKPLTAQDLSAVYNNKTDKLMINGNQEMAKPGLCAIREVSMIVNIPELPADTYVFPTCIKVFQCGGCCNTASVSCQAVASKRTVYNLMLVTVERGDQTPRVTGTYPVEVTEHTACSCRCTLSSDSCGPMKTYDERVCQCFCKSHPRCAPPHYFNPETCRCECAERLQCCPDEDYCGILFNETTCECQQSDYKQFIASAPKENQDQRNKDISRVAVGNQARPPQTTPTIQGSRASVLCLGIVCPFKFGKMRNSEGRCVCTAKDNTMNNGLIVV